MRSALTARWALVGIFPFETKHVYLLYARKRMKKENKGLLLFIYSAESEWIRLRGQWGGLYRLHIFRRSAENNTLNKFELHSPSHCELQLERPGFPIGRTPWPQ